MIHSEADLRAWKQKQIDYFKGYLDNFKKGSREYTFLLTGIQELEKNK